MIEALVHQMIARSRKSPDYLLLINLNFLDVNEYLLPLATCRQAPLAALEFDSKVVEPVVLHPMLGIDLAIPDLGDYDHLRVPKHFRAWCGPGLCIGTPIRHQFPPIP